MTQPKRGEGEMTKLQKDCELVRRCIVEKWALLVVKPEMDEPTCPLCAVYDSEVTVQCVGCPIYEKTGSILCRGTPYTDWVATVETARAMEDFLWALYDELTARISREPSNAEKINGKSVTITARASEDQRISIAITKRQIVGAICHEHGVTVPASSVEIAAPITQLGVFDVKVHFFREDAATVKVWVVQAEDNESACIICGAPTGLRNLAINAPYVCAICRREYYDADGYYLVPVVRGGPWGGDGTLWERWQDGVYHWMYYDCRVRGGIVEAREAGPGDWLPRSSYGETTAAHPGIVFKAPADYIGDVPEGCRWAEGSDPKPYKVLEGSVDGKTWFEMVRSQDVNTIMMPGASAHRYTRMRIVGIDGKTKDVHTTDHGGPKPKGTRITTRDTVTDLGQIMRDIAGARRRKTGGVVADAFQICEDEVKRLLERLAE